MLPAIGTTAGGTPWLQRRPPSSGQRRSSQIGFWRKLVDRLIDDSFDALLGHAGLPRRHWQVLHLLQAAPATVQQIDAQLAPFLGGDEPTTRPILDDLQARSWITWTDEQATLTEAGSAAHADLRQQVARGVRGLLRASPPRSTPPPSMSCAVWRSTLAGLTPHSR
jgi:hypothetical protein